MFVSGNYAVTYRRGIKKRFAWILFREGKGGAGEWTVRRFALVFGVREMRRPDCYDVECDERRRNVGRMNENWLCHEWNTGC